LKIENRGSRIAIFHPLSSILAFEARLGQISLFENFYALCTAAILKSLRSLRKFSGGPWLSKRGLLAPRRQERQVRKFKFFAAFAPLREIFRVLVAALPR
jgi:hypothetical protein